jgi:hypothetical protein
MEDLNKLYENSQDNDGKSIIPYLIILKEDGENILAEYRQLVFDKNIDNKDDIISKMQEIANNKNFRIWISKHLL